MSRRGIGVVLLALGAIVCGLLLGWVTMTAIGIGLIGLVAATWFLNLPAAASWTDVSAPVRVPRGGSASVEIAVTIPTGSTTWVSAVEEDGAHRSWVPASNVTTTLSWPIDTSRRGLYGGGPARLEAADPFGLRYRMLATREPSPVLVVPCVRRVDPPTLGRFGVDGDADDRPGSDSFHSLREYIVGDPMKMVHWRTSARAGKLMVRRMVDTTIPWLMIVLDVNARAYDTAGAIFEDFDPDAFEQSVETAASYAWWGCGTQQRVLLTTTSSSATSVEVTASTRESALDWLALVSAESPDNCGPARIAALAHRQGISNAVLVTGRRIETSTSWVNSWQRTLPVSVIVGHA